MLGDEDPTAFTPFFLSLLHEAEAFALREAGEVLVRLAQDSAVVRALVDAGEDAAQPLPLTEARRRIALVVQALGSLRRVIDHVRGRLELPPRREREERLESGDYTPALGLYVDLETLLHDKLDPLIAELESLGEPPGAGA